MVLLTKEGPRMHHCLKHHLEVEALEYAEDHQAERHTRESRVHLFPPIWSGQPRHQASSRIARRDARSPDALQPCGYRPKLGSVLYGGTLKPIVLGWARSFMGEP